MRARESAASRSRTAETGICASALFAVALRCASDNDRIGKDRIQARTIATITLQVSGRTGWRTVRESTPSVSMQAAVERLPTHWRSQRGRSRSRRRPRCRKCSAVTNRRPRRSAVMRSLAADARQPAEHQRLFVGKSSGLLRDLPVLRCANQQDSYFWRQVRTSSSKPA